MTPNPQEEGITRKDDEQALNLAIETLSQPTLSEDVVDKIMKDVFLSGDEKFDHENILPRIDNANKAICKLALPSVKLPEKLSGDSHYNSDGVEVEPVSYNQALSDVAKLNQPSGEGYEDC